MPKSRRTYLGRLNEALQQAAEGNLDSSVQKDLWKWYSMCRKDVQAIADEIPMEIWSTLWEAFSGISISPADPMRHIRALGDDMEAARISLDPAQQITYMEALYLDGNCRGAIDRWESFAVSMNNSDSIFKEYWELGVRMFANFGQPRRAQNAANVLINSLGGREARIIIPIIKSWLISGDSAAVQRAWALYIRMKHLVATDMEMQDYDAVISLFLSAEQTSLALGAFKDMMLTGDSLASEEDSVALYKKVMGKVGNLQSMEIPAAEISWNAFRPLTTLPKKLRNKFFYGSWIKKLIGEGNLDGASQVLDLMSHRNICPDAKHTNGLIGAWFREGSAASQSRAEEMAWKMIQTRMNSIKSQENRFLSQGGLVRAIPTIGKPGFIHIQRSGLLPSATIETFIVLLENYRRRTQFDRVEDVYVALKAAKIRTNTAFFNQQLLTYLRSRRKQKAWTAYTKAVADGIQPDMETFGYLWHIMKIHVDPVMNRTREGYPDCRSMFAEMMKWAPTLSKRDTLERGMYDLIILCFGLADDQAGTAIALRAMHGQFGAYPSDDTARSIILQLAKAGSRNVEGLRPRRLNLNSSTKARIHQVSKVLQKFKQRREEALLQRGMSYADLDANAMAEESLRILTDTLRFVVQTRVESATSDEGADGQLPVAETAAAEAARAMGVPQWNPWQAEWDNDPQTLTKALFGRADGEIPPPPVE